MYLCDLPADARSKPERITQPAPIPGCSASSCKRSGVCGFYQDDAEAARTYTEESLAIWHDRGDCRFVASTLHNLGEMSLHWGELDRALTQLQQALAIPALHADLPRFASALESCVKVALARNETARAVRFLGALDTLLADIQLGFADLDPTHLDELRARAASTLDPAQAAAAWSEGTTLRRTRVIDGVLAWH